MTPYDIRGAVRRGEVRPDHKLGQYFLTDVNIAKKIIEAAELAPGDHIIEVGPGVCALTELLCGRAGSVAAVEIDGRLTGIIHKTMAPYGNFVLISGDILETPTDLLLPAGYAGSVPKPDIKLIANIPYYISTPIITRIFTDFTFVAKAVLMVQKELADKLTAKPSAPGYCALTVFTDAFFTVRKLFTVPPHCFAPQPGVESAVMLFDAPAISRPERRIDRRFFMRVVKAAFAERRKTLENNLLRAGLVSGRDRASEVLARAGVAKGARGESLDACGFMALTRALAAESKADSALLQD